MLKSKGRLYLSFPIASSNQTHFNAHRVYNPKSILEFECIKESLNLIKFDLVDDNGNLIMDTEVNQDFSNLKYGCGIYTFEKK